MELVYYKLLTSLSCGYRIRCCSDAAHSPPADPQWRLLATVREFNDLLSTSGAMS
jgi:hypothetical protein